MSILAAILAFLKAIPALLGFAEKAGAAIKEADKEQNEVEAQKRWDEKNAAVDQAIAAALAAPPDARLSDVLPPSKVVELRPPAQKG